MKPPAADPLATRLGAPELVLVRYGELALKGGNRPLFEQALVRNMRHAVREISAVKVTKSRGRMAVIPDERTVEVATRLQDVFGVASLSPAWGCAHDADQIAELGRAVTARAMRAKPADRKIPFRVATRRGDKTFPMISTELDRYVADRVLPDWDGRLRVDLGAPELELGIDVRRERVYVFAERLPGLGGLPVGTLGRATCLLSGGIDSPVAAWLAMKRGCTVSFVSFHSYPYLGESSKRKIVQLVRALARYQYRSRLFVVPFTECQTAIRDHAPEPYRTVLYRRMMQRLGNRIAARDGAGALVTGESLGQVASQTMENLTCIEEAGELPVLRPLVCFDKDETIAIARRIGTLEISNLPEPDCCTVFQPTKPIIRGKVEVCHEAEEALDVEGLVDRALDGVEVVDV